MTDVRPKPVKRPKVPATLPAPAALAPYYAADTVSLYQGSCLDVLARFPSACVDTVVTDPPYELGMMGKAWDSSGVAFQKATWATVLRVVKPGGFLLAFGGTRTWHRLVCAVEDAGWEVRDCLMWLYGSGFPKSLDISKAVDRAAGAVRASTGEGLRATHAAGNFGLRNRCPQCGKPKFSGNPCRCPKPKAVTTEARVWQGWGTCLKPSWEPILLAMRPLDGNFAANARAHGVAGLNIEGARLPTGDNLGGGAYAKKGTDRADGYEKWRFRRTGGAGDYTPPTGRWPANTVLDEDAAEAVDAQSGITKSSGGSGAASHGGMGKRVFGEYAPCSTARNAGGLGDRGGASRFFYVAKASKKDRGPGNEHPTVKPRALMEWLCRLTATPTGGVVLDPFAGSGTTLLAAQAVGRRAVGIELMENYCAIARRRLSAEPKP